MSTLFFIVMIISLNVYGGIPGNGFGAITEEYQVPIQENEVLPIQKGQPNEEAQKLSEQQQGDTDRVVEILDRIIGKIPSDRYKQGLEAYKKIVFGEDGGAYGQYGGGVGGSNNGIINHFKGLVSENLCFEELALAFYNNLSDLDKKYQMTDSEINNDPLHGRSSQEDFTGKGRFKDLSPGFLWEMALKHSNNDPSLAMKLIGMCGNDDVTIRINSIRCPGNRSVMYLSGALGEDFDISTKLREDIVSKQAPEMGAKVIPSKNYHILGGAYMACTLIEEGVHPLAAKFIEENSAKAYRSLRMNSRIESYLKQKETLVKEYEEAKSKAQEEGVDLLPDFEIFLASRYGTEWKEIILNMDAATIYSIYTIGGNETISFNTPIPSPQRPIDEAFIKLGKKPPRFKKWSEDRFKRAKEKFDTWDVDIKWTANQHGKGAEFAAKKCKPKFDKKDFGKECEQAHNCVENDVDIKHFITDAQKIIEELNAVKIEEEENKKKLSALFDAFKKKHGNSPNLGIYISQISPDSTLEDLENLHENNKNGLNTDMHFLAESNKVKKLKEAYKDKHGTEPEYGSAVGYIEPEWTLEDLEKAEANLHAQIAIDESYSKIKKEYFSVHGKMPSLYIDNIALINDLKQLEEAQKEIEMKHQVLIQKYKEKTGKDINMNDVILINPDISFELFSDMVEGNF